MVNKIHDLVRTNIAVEYLISNNPTHCASDHDGIIHGSNYELPLNCTHTCPSITPPYIVIRVRYYQTINTDKVARRKVFDCQLGRLDCSDRILPPSLYAKNDQRHTHFE